MFGPKSKILKVKQLPSDVKGLSYRPSISTELDDYDAIQTYLPNCRPPAERINGNIDVIKSVLIAMSDSCQGIVEIGVVYPSRKSDSNTSTEIFLANKLDSTPYLGIDLSDNTHIDNESKRVHTIMCSSFEQEKVREKIKEIGMEKISILMIDGLHSINAVINDWEYSDLLAENGVVIFHDTNFHPGPVSVVDALDESLYKVIKFFNDRNDDYGITVVRKK